MLTHPLAALAGPGDPAAAGAFTQGVASGEPGERGITLWTRLAGVDRPARVRLEVARDPGFGSVVASTEVRTRPEEDHTARLRLERGPLRPGEQYYYRFATRTADSPVGRFRTARPADSRETVRVGFFSCQEHIAGYYTAHADMAARDDLDLVVCLGDYVYEQAFASTGSASPPVRADATAPDGETQTLDEYRAKYALYHTDPALLEVRRRHPLVAIWDDHEVEDNYAGGAARNRRVPFGERKLNGYRAWNEAMPRVRPEGTRNQIYGSLRLGATEVFLLDTRQYRGDQPCNPSDGPLSAPCPMPVTDDPSRPLLGAAQSAWLRRALGASRARWKVVANQMMVMSLDAPPRNPLNTDAWDGYGYGAERRGLLDFIAARGISDVAFVTGDIHTFFAGNVTRTGRQLARGERAPPLDGPPRATEFVGGAITSPGLVDRAATSEAERVAAAAAADAFVLANNPHIVYANQAYKGYGVLEAAADELRVEYRAVRDTRTPTSEVFTLRRFRVARGLPYVEDLGGPVPLPAPGSPGPLPPPAV